MKHKSKNLGRYISYLEDESKLDLEIEREDRNSRILLVLLMIAGLIRLAMMSGDDHSPRLEITFMDIILTGLGLVAFLAIRMRLHSLYVVKALLLREADSDTGVTQ